MALNRLTAISYRLATKLNKLMAEINYNLFEKYRYKIVSEKNFLTNNYTQTMLKFLELQNRNSYKSMPYERKLFLQVAKCFIVKSLSYKNNLSGIDFGGGLGYQAKYLQDILGNIDSSKIDVLEQIELVQSLKEINYTHQYDKCNIHFIDTLPESDFTYDYSFFNGSLSYIDDPLAYLEKPVFGKLICISRLPVCNEINENMIVYDSFGGHYEIILSESSLNMFLKNVNILFDEYDILSKSKSTICGKSIKSRNIIFERE